MNLHGVSRGKAEPRGSAPDPAAPPRPQAGFFGPRAAPLFGWLHGAATGAPHAAAGVVPAAAAAPATAGPAAAPALGLVVCAPLGHEMTNAHRSLRALAVAAAAAGVPALRFDYAGCGDSADPPPGSAAMAAWLASIDEAVCHLRRCTGVRRVALLGLRSGALLALAAAARHGAANAEGTEGTAAAAAALGAQGDADRAGAAAAVAGAVAAVVALAPVVSGQRLLREWRALQSTAALRSARGDGALEVAGHLFDAATCSALGALTLPAAPAVRHLLVLDRDDLPGADRWVTALRDGGAQVQHRRLPGFAAMLDEPQRHVVPDQVVRQTVDWLRERAAEIAAAEPGAAAAGTEPGAAAAAAAWAGRDQPAAVAPAVRERPLHLRGSSPGAEVFGIVSETAAAAAAPARSTMLLVNTGPVHHVGGNRLYVMLARRLAARGHRVLRLDLTGIGDSPARPGEADNVVYGLRASEDIALALAGLQAPHGQAPHDSGGPVELLGLCSGGYHALKYALAHDGVARAFVVNPLVFYWKPGMSLEAGEVDVQAAYYSTKWRDPRRWWRLFSGQSDLRLLAQVSGGRARARLGWLLRWLRRGGMTLALDDLADDLAAIARRGTHLHFVFSHGEPGLRLLHAEAGASAAGLQQAGALSIHTLDAADHTFTTEDARARFMAHVEQAIEGRPAGR